jgi:hypothetical protein
MKHRMVMHRRWAPLLGAASLWLGAAGSAAAAQGTVIWRNADCGYFVVQASRSYILFEWVSGATPREGDVIDGELKNSGTLQMHDRTADLPIAGFVAARASTSSEVEKKIPEKCR